MLKFWVFDEGKPASQRTLRNALLVGSDHSPLRAEIWFENGLICCEKREAGAAALMLQQPVGECGELTLQTCLLPEREQPYLLNLELARHRLMLTYNKLEEWAMFDLGDDHPVTRRVEKARRLFIQALCNQTSAPSKADELGLESLITSIDASEELSLAHAEILLTRRRSVNSLPKYPLGGGVWLAQTHERIRTALASNFDFLALPTPWRSLVPTEDQYKWEVMDDWVEWAVKHHLPILAGPIVSFDPTVLPDWIYMWEHEYETVRDLLYEHTQQLINRYKNVITLWKVVSGLHVNNNFPFGFDQIMELTRMCCLLVKKLHPQSKVLVELRQPFGEYYSSNARSIPPMMYTDLLIQNNVNFDGFSLRYLMGQAQPGQYARDLMQISQMLDHYGSYGKPMHLSFAVPSEPVTEMMLIPLVPDEPVDADCGIWRKPWTQLVQSRWLEAIHYIALSKPFVESVTWSEMVDHPAMELPLSGLVGEDLQPKTAFRRLVSFRRMLQTKPGPHPSAVEESTAPASNSSVPTTDSSTATTSASPMPSPASPLTSSDTPASMPVDTASLEASTSGTNKKSSHRNTSSSKKKNS